MARLRDIDIRNCLHSTVLVAHRADPSTVIIDELGILQGENRVDIAVVNGTLHGFEIKSERDTLQRLPGQIESYNRVFDYVTIVASGGNLDGLDEIVPPWWEITQAILGTKATVELIPIRPGCRNPNVDARSVVELLWRDEALALLEARGADWGVRSKPRHYIWDRVCEVFDIDEIREVVRRSLKKRQDQGSRRVREAAL